MAKQNVKIVSIHDEDPSSGVLSFDLKDVLKALQNHLGSWSFCVIEIDAVGKRVDEFCDAVQSARGRGIWASREELEDIAARAEQTISAEILGFPAELNRSSLSEQDLNLACFPVSKAEVAIVAVDSSYFEVYAKNSAVLDAIRGAFQDVREEDPAPYFSA
jgi:hypothetical protein